MSVQTVKYDRQHPKVYRPTLKSVHYRRTSELKECYTEITIPPFIRTYKYRHYKKNILFSVRSRCKGTMSPLILPKDFPGSIQKGLKGVNTHIFYDYGETVCETIVTHVEKK